MTEEQAKTGTIYTEEGVYVQEGVYVHNDIELSDWECQLFGTGQHGFVYTPIKGHEPNWFWRWMQYICFGNKWVRRAK